MLKPGLQRWLQQHCESSERVSGGVIVVTGQGAGLPQTVAQWPESGTLTPPLLAVAQAAVQRATQVVVVPAMGAAGSDHNRVISTPLRAGGKLLGAVALAVRADDGAAVDQLFKELNEASAEVGGSLAFDGPALASDAARVVNLQASLLRHATLAEGALALASDLAAMLGCERVALGVIERHQIEVVALSHSAEFKAEQELLHLIAAAMREAADQGTRLICPAGPTEPARIILAHAELNARTGLALATVPLVHNGAVVGALLAESRLTPTFPAESLALLESVACLVGPVVELRRQAERAWPARTADAAHGLWQSITRPDEPLLRLGLVAAAGVLLVATSLPVAYRVGAPARIEGAVQQVVAAPLDGFLRKTHVRPGDAVHAGDLLLELADQDLVLEQRKWESALTQHENGYAAALARADRAQFVISQGKASEARAQLELVRQQLARTRLLAPMDGVVIKGDLSQALGAPVQRGDALLTIAPLDRYRLIVDVDERDIASVQTGQTGALALSAFPVDTVPFVVERVTPVSQVREGRNAFEVEARLTGAAPAMRPGLQGVAKIDAGERSFAWVWGHRAADWLRLTLWSWGA